jgi:hypothetical protein
VAEATRERKGARRIIKIAPEAFGVNLTDFFSKFVGEGWEDEETITERSEDKRGDSNKVDHGT